MIATLDEVLETLGVQKPTPLLTDLLANYALAQFEKAARSNTSYAKLLKVRADVFTVGAGSCVKIIVELPGVKEIAWLQLQVADGRIAVYHGNAARVRPLDEFGSVVIEMIKFIREWPRAKA